MAPRNLQGQNQRVSACLIGRRNRIARIPVTRFLKRNKLVPILKQKLKHSLNGAGTASGKARVGGRGRPSVKAKNLQVEKRITHKSKSQADNISNSRNHARECALKLRGIEVDDRKYKATVGRRPESLVKLYFAQKRLRIEQLRLSRALEVHDSDDDSDDFSDDDSNDDSDDVSDDDSDDDLVDHYVYNADDDSDDDSLYDDNPNDDPDYALDDDQLFEHMVALLEQEEALEESSESPATMTREST